MDASLESDRTEEHVLANATTIPPVSSVRRGLSILGQSQRFTVAGFSKRTERNREKPKPVPRLHLPGASAFSHPVLPGASAPRGIELGKLPDITNFCCLQQRPEELLITVELV
jgi:hypothetical protein